MKLRLLLADDHHLIREAIRALLEREQGLDVVGEEADGLRVAAEAARLDIDVLVLELAMPGLDGIEIISRVRRESPRTRIVVLTNLGHEAHVLEALRRGASAYVLKRAQAADFVAAIHAVAAGEVHVSPPLPRNILATFRRDPQPGGLDLYATLTRREREVLHLAAEGLSNPEVAVRLAISTRTVETHRANLLRKLRLRGQTELVRYVVGRGLTPRPGQ